MNLEEKKKLAKTLIEDVESEEKGIEFKHPFQETDFENPFNTCPPAANGKIIKTQDGVCHAPALKPDKWVPLALKSYTDVSDKMGAFVFSLPKDTDHTGCFAGQYVVTQGLISQHFQLLKPGDKVEFQGPCGGFEYEENQLDELTLLASGGGITPGMQLIRQSMKNVIHYGCGKISCIPTAKDDRLKIVYSLGEAPANWEGEEGFIDTQMIDKHVSKPNGLKHKIVMCGGPTMSISCLYSLRSLGFPSSNIFIYGQFGTEQVKTVYGRNVKLASHRCDNAV
ncbi:NADH-cytochrome b5 reductase 1-like 1 [Homarus americanus]|uniref:NADH-cytochrome b5 reductase 1-like 1 n=1 Tax=Homarus americanus TaxID=6706 RepID=A0A8J5T790_HOMAM|nr:NADH-cytochrome b5 reductase 1-like 1 [Homarus americanus]